MSKRAERRFKNEIKKRKYSKILKQNFDLNEKDLSERHIGKYANSHGAICSCEMCRNPRRSNLTKDVNTLQERKNFLNFKD